MNKENADVMESAQLCILLSKDCAAMFVQWGKMEGDLCACKECLQNVFAPVLHKSLARMKPESHRAVFSPWPKITVGPNPGREKPRKCSLWTFTLATFVCHDNSNAGDEDALK